jgi:DNA-binding MarR family transcriptional regulator
VLLKEQGKESFHARDIRRELRLAPTTLKRYLSELERYGYIKVRRAGRYAKYEYTVADYTEYEQLQSVIDQHVQAILDNVQSRK